MEILSFIFWAIIILLGFALIGDLRDNNNVGGLKILLGIIFIFFMIFLIVT